MGRRFISRATAPLVVFIIAWAAVLSVPELRHLLQRQAEGSNAWEQGSPSTRFAPLAPIVRLLEPKPPTFSELAARYPDDVRVQLLAKEDAFLQQQLAPVPIPASQQDQSDSPQAFTLAYRDPGLPTARAYSEMIARYPRQAWLLANRLRLSLSGDPMQLRTVRDEIEREFARPKKTPLEKARLREEALSSIALAQRGRELEPDNCYFDWILASHLFALNRDDEAMRILHEGARKPRYDEHMAEDAQARFAAQRMMRDPIFEEKLAASAAIMFLNYSVFRQTTRIAIGKGVLKERAGDNTSALQIYGDVATLAARIRDTDFATYFSAIFCEGTQNLAWRRGREWTPGERQQFKAAKNSWVAQGELAASSFAPYAESHGRADLARQAQRDSQVNGSFYEQSRQYMDDGAFGISMPVLGNIFMLHWLCATLMSQLQTTIFVWLALTIVLLRAKSSRRKRDTPRMSTHVAREDDVMRPNDVASVVLWSGCAVGVLLLVAARAKAARHPFSDDSDQFGLSLLSILLTLAPVVLCALYIGTVSWWRRHRQMRAARVLNLRPVEARAITEKPSLKGELARGARLFVSLILLIAVVATWISFFGIDLTGTRMQAIQESDLGYPLVASTLALLWWNILWRRGDASARLNTLGNLRWYLRSLGVMIALSSVAYAIFAFSSLPARLQANTRLDDYMKRGEMALIRETKLLPP